MMGGWRATLGLLAAVLIAAVPRVYADNVGCVDGNGSCDTVSQTIVRGPRRKKDDSQYIDSFGCGSTKSVPFCWWAIEVGNPDWTLLRNGLSPLIETSIEPFCRSPKSAHGFSFTNTTTKSIYIQRSDTRFRTVDHPFETIVDVFYVCCANQDMCKKFMELTDGEMMDYLAGMVLKYTNMANGVVQPTDWMCTGDDGQPLAKMPGVDVCVFVASTAIATTVYNGPMLFNRFVLANEYRLSIQSVSLSSLVVEGRLCRTRKPEVNHHARNPQGFGEGSINPEQNLYRPRNPEGFDDGTISLGRKFYDPRNPEGFDDGTIGSEGLDDGTVHREDHGNYLEHEQCLRYIARNEYLLFCCCYNNDDFCSYSESPENEATRSANRNYWLNKREMYAVHDVRRGNNLISAQKWSYRDFIHSIPVVSKSRTHVAVVTLKNQHMWHCMQGTVMMRDDTTSDNYDNAKRGDNPFRLEHARMGKSCYVDAKISFYTAGNKTKIEFEYGDTFEHCGSMSCQLKKPQCSDKLLEKGRALIHVVLRCCCSTHNLCNHIESAAAKRLDALKTVDFSKICFGGTYSLYASLMSGNEVPTTVTCLHYFDYGQIKERLMLEGETLYVPIRKNETYVSQYFNNSTELQFKIILGVPLLTKQCQTEGSRHVMQFGVLYCTGHISTYMYGTCDINYKQQFSAKIAEAKRAVCYEGKYIISVDGISPQFPGGMELVNTTSVPLCYNEVVLINVNGTVIIKSGIVDANAKHHTLRFQTPNVTLRSDSKDVLGFHIGHVCDSVTGSGQACNGLQSAMQQLMSSLMIFYATTAVDRNKVTNGEIRLGWRSARPQQKCFTASNNKVACSTPHGCYHYHDVHGNALAGCIDDLPNLRIEHPELSAMVRCRNMLWSVDDTVCNAIMDSNSPHGRAGMLCCCRSKCPAPVEKSPTYMSTGFNPFNF